jgi:hypothetical protein
VENVTHFNQAAVYDGTVGVGCGHLSSRPVAGTATTAYWATDQPVTYVDSQCAGVNPAHPIVGTLYRYSGAAWSALYTPYTYPHPLRTQGALADVASEVTDIPSAAILPQLTSVSPNPSTGKTISHFHLSGKQSVGIQIFNPSGRLIYKVYNMLNSRSSDLVWDAFGLAPGVYYYLMRASGKTITNGKVVIIRP